MDKRDGKSTKTGEVFQGKGLRLILASHMKEDRERNNPERYGFQIYLSGGELAGAVFFSPDTSYNRYRFGEISYSVHPRFRGNRVAARACMAMKEFIRRKGYRRAFIAVKAENEASLKTAGHIGARLVPPESLPDEELQAELVSNRVCLFEWRLEDCPES